MWAHPRGTKWNRRGPIGRCRRRRAGSAVHLKRQRFLVYPTRADRTNATRERPGEARRARPRGSIRRATAAYSPACRPPSATPAHRCAEARPRLVLGRPSARRKGMPKPNGNFPQNTERGIALVELDLRQRRAAHPRRDGQLVERQSTRLALLAQLHANPPGQSRPHPRRRRAEAVPCAARSPRLVCVWTGVFSFFMPPSLRAPYHQPGSDAGLAHSLAYSLPESGLAQTAAQKNFSSTGCRPRAWIQVFEIINKIYIGPHKTQYCPERGKRVLLTLDLTESPIHHCRIQEFKMRFRVVPTITLFVAASFLACVANTHLTESNPGSGGSTGGTSAGGTTRTGGTTSVGGGRGPRICR